MIHSDVKALWTKQTDLAMNELANQQITNVDMVSIDHLVLCCCMIRLTQPNNSFLNV